MYKYCSNRCLVRDDKGRSARYDRDLARVSTNSNPVTVKTYCAPRRAASCGAAILPIRVFARAGDISLNLHTALERGTGGRLIGKHRDICDAPFGTNTKVHRSVVAQRRAWSAPLASLRSAISNWVEVVLSRRRLSLPLIVRGSIRHGQRL